MSTMDFSGVASDAFPAKAGPTVNAKAGLDRWSLSMLGNRYHWLVPFTANVTQAT